MHVSPLGFFAVCNTVVLYRTVHTLLYCTVSVQSIQYGKSPTLSLALAREISSTPVPEKRGRLKLKAL